MIVSSIVAVWLEYRGQKEIESKAAHGYEQLDGDKEMGDINKSDDDSFISDKGDILRASFAD